MKKNFYIIYFVFFLASFSFSATYYVDTTCTDINIDSPTVDGTGYDPATPACTGGSDSYYVTVEDVNEKISAGLSAGDSVLFRKGQTWSLAAGGEDKWLVIDGIDGSDLSSNAITFGSFGTGNRPIFDGTSTTSGGSWRGLVYFRDCSYIIFEGIEIYNADGNGVDINAWDSSCGSTVTYVIFRDNELDTSRNSDFQLMYVGFGESTCIQTTNNITITANIIHNTGHNCIRLDNTASSTVSYNEIYDCVHVGIDNNWDSSKNSYSSTGLEYIGNEIYNTGAGFYPINLDDSTIAYNLVYDSIYDPTQGDSWGIKMLSEVGTKATGPDNLTIHNNIFWDIDSCVTCTYTAGIYYGYMQDADIYNNTFFSNYRACRDEGTHDTINFTNNLLYSSSNSGCASDYASDPKFTNTSVDDFTLQASSPVIGEGTDLGNGLDYGLDPTTTWTDGVILVDQDDYNDTGDVGSSGWELGAFVFEAELLTGEAIDGVSIN